MSGQITSSAIVARALGLKPDGVASKEAGHCAYCGQGIEIGDPVTPFQPGLAFMDTATLAVRGSTLVCGNCTQLLGAEALRNSGYGVFHSGGVMPFQKWAHVAYALNNPPEPPFVAVYATANNQHMAWRAPVTFSRDLIYVRVGLRDLKIRKPYLDAAVQSAVYLGSEMITAGLLKPGVDSKTLPNPFIALSANLKMEKRNPVAHVTGVFRPKLFSEDFWKPQYESHVNTLKGMTTGELWALRFIMTPNAGKKG